MRGQVKINKIQITQRSLNRKEQISGLVEAIRDDVAIERITLLRYGDLVQVWDGHHRLAAYYLAGRDKLSADEYELIEKVRPLHGFGSIGNLVLWTLNECLVGT